MLAGMRSACGGAQLPLPALRHLLHVSWVPSRHLLPLCLAACLLPLKLASASLAAKISGRRLCGAAAGSRSAIWLARISGAFSPCASSYGSASLHARPASPTAASAAYISCVQKSLCCSACDANVALRVSRRPKQPGVVRCILIYLFVVSPPSVSVPSALRLLPYMAGNGSVAGWARRTMAKT